jgi:DNA-binding transcriptional ArsR family regulator
MDAGPDLSQLARAIGEPTRVRMLTLLMDGRALTAKELAYGAGVTPATATGHLSRLAGESLVRMRPQGRHRYFQLASPEVARCIEALLAIARPTAPGAGTPEPALHRARFCYDHLAGKLGTRITASLVERRVLVRKGPDFQPTAMGTSWLRTFGVDAEEAARARRKLAPACLDWSERQDHLGGALGAALAQRLLTERWIRRHPGSRAVAITPAGSAALAHWFGIAQPSGG